MGYDLKSRLVVGVASSALFDLTDSDKVFKESGEEAYRNFQREHLEKRLEPGVAFPFVRQVLGLNQIRPEDPLVEVVMLSRNDPDTGRRALRSAQSYGLGITRAAFLNGASPHSYVGAFECELFLSANVSDVRAAVEAGRPAGHVTGSGPSAHDEADQELRIAFDFDGVLADDSSEAVFSKEGLESFKDHEVALKDTPLNSGPLKPFLERIAQIQQLERSIKDHTPLVRTALVTARGAPAHERVVTTLAAWGVALDEAFFLGGVEKTEVLKTFSPHIFFDDQRAHLDRTAPFLPSVHVPFGVKNKAPKE